MTVRTTKELKKYIEAMELLRIQSYSVKIEDVSESRLLSWLKKKKIVAEGVGGWIHIHLPYNDWDPLRRKKKVY